MKRRSDIPTLRLEKPASSHLELSWFSVGSFQVSAVYSLDHRRMVFIKDPNNPSEVIEFEGFDSSVEMIYNTFGDQYPCLDIGLECSAEDMKLMLSGYDGVSDVSNHLLVAIVLLFPKVDVIDQFMWKDEEEFPFVDVEVLT